MQLTENPPVPMVLGIGSAHVLRIVKIIKYVTRLAKLAQNESRAIKTQ